MNEIWKELPILKGCYLVSNLGRIKSIPRNGTVKYERIIISKLNNCGYVIVNLRIKGFKKTFYVHRLVAEAFIENNFNKEQINHIDGDKCNNNIFNLEWCTPSENINHAKKNGLQCECPNRIKIKQYDIMGNYLNTFNSIKEASTKTNSYASAIGLCVRGKRKQTNNFIWKKSND